MKQTVMMKKLTEVEIEFPHYCAWGSSYMKILNPDDMVQVNINPEYGSGIRLYKNYQSFIVDCIAKGVTITPEKFNDVYTSIYEMLEGKQFADEVPEEDLELSADL